MAYPIITIGITCHNAADTIERAANSALEQSWPAFEVVIVDDCSTDNSWLLLQKLAAADARVHILRHQENKGYPAALNTIMAHARGEFVAIFDDDDENVEDRLKAQYARILEYERKTGAQLILCYSNRNVVKVGEAVVDHVALAIGRIAPEPHGPPVADYLLSIGIDPRFVWGMFGSCTLMGRRSTFAKVGPFDEKFRRCAEWDMAIRAAFLGAHFIAVDRSLITQYKTKSIEKSGAAPLKYMLMLREKYRTYLVGRGFYLASCARAKASFYRSKQKKFRGLYFVMLSYIVGPRLVFSRIRRLATIRF